MIKLPIPIFYKDQKYTHVTIDEPESGTIVDAHKIAKDKDHFTSTLIMLAGSVKEIHGENGSVTEKSLIKTVLYKLPWRSAEFLLEEIMLLMDADADYVEGAYTCDRNGCWHTQYAEYKEQDGVIIDTRDLVSQLRVNYLDDSHVNCINMVLEKPTTIINQNDQSVLAQISSIELEFPTLEHCITAYAKQGDSDRTRTKFGIWLEAMTKVDGQYIDQKWKNQFGMFFFNHIKRVSDLKKLAQLTNEYGRIPYVEKICPKCGKTFKALINTSGFFGSALDT